MFPIFTAVNPSTDPGAMQHPAITLVNSDGTDYVPSAYAYVS